MKKCVGTTLAVVLVVIFSAVPAVWSAHGKKQTEKTAILLVTFGTSVPQAQVAFAHIGEKVHKAFPGIEVRWAYTSVIIRKKLAKKGQFLDSPETALAKLMDEGFTHVAVQSLHIIPGFEFDDVKRNVDLFARMAGGFTRLSLGRSLLGNDEDLVRVSRAMAEMVPAARQKNEAVVWMGHGTHHPANALYAALMYRLQLAEPNTFIGCVEAFPEIDIIKQQLVARGIHKVFLQPLMSVAGDHARNDMTGPRDDSWSSILAKAGISSQPVLKGLAEYDVFVDIWITHLKKAMKQIGH